MKTVDTVGDLLFPLHPTKFYSQLILDLITHFIKEPVNKVPVLVLFLLLVFLLVCCTIALVVVTSSIIVLIL